MSDLVQGELVEGAGGSLPIRIVAKLRHGVIDDLVEQHGRQELAKILGVCTSTISNWANLKTIPSFEGGNGRGSMSKEKARSVAVKLCKLSGKRLEDIFPSFARKALEDTPRTIVVDRPLTEGEAAEAIARRDSQQRLAGPAPILGAVHSELKSDLAKAMKCLSYREREIVKLRYGLNDGYSYTLEEVGKIFKVTRDRIRQIEAKAICKLRRTEIASELVGHTEELATA